MPLHKDLISRLGHLLNPIMLKGTYQRLLSKFMPSSASTLAVNVVFGSGRFHTLNVHRNVASPEHFEIIAYVCQFLDRVSMTYLGLNQNRLESAVC